MSYHSVLGRALVLGTAGVALAVGCGSDDEKNVSQGGAGEAGARPGGGEAGAALVGGSAGESSRPVAGAGGEATAGSTTVVNEGGAAGAGGVGGAGGDVAAPLCVPELPCDTNPSAPCRQGTTECGEDGQSSCVDGGTGPEGASCPSGTCHGGACIPPFRLFNTGVDDEGVVLQGGTVDPHYALIESAEPTVPGPDAVVVTQIAEGFWLPQSEASQWIAPTPDQSYPGPMPCNALGTYVYRTTFDLTGYDPDSLIITGGWAADNTGADVRLNGEGLGLPAGSYTPLTTFVIDGGFVAGLNTLDFVVTDYSCPSGLRVELTASEVQLAVP